MRSAAPLHAQHVGRTFSENAEPEGFGPVNVPPSRLHLEREAQWRLFNCCATSRKGAAL